MKLDEMLEICLLVLEHRFPGCAVEGDAAMFQELALTGEPITPTQMLELLQASVPHLLQAPTRLIVDEQRSEISLLEISEERPAFRLYCEGWSQYQRAMQL
jgi:hypothetical protein